VKTKHKVASGVILGYMQLMGYIGWTSFWDTVYYLDKECLRNQRLRRHEGKHIEQINRDGYIVFTIKYLWYSFKYSYHKNPYEIEARKAEDGIS